MRPELHAELNRRIAASIDLIKLNRPQAILKTQQRFRGWATSIPPGGTPKEGKAKLKKVEQKKELRKALASLPFEERRVAIDQSAKLFAAINTTVAVNGGAIGAYWQAHGPHQKGYDGRPAHNARDGKFFLIRNSWADKVGFVKPNSDGYTDEIEQVAELPFCFPGDSPIPYADGVTVGYRRRFTGDLTEIITSTGRRVRATPNHPILTPKGWVAISLLNEGDDVIEVGEESLSEIKLNYNNTIPTISQVFCTLKKFGIITSSLSTLKQFHGDGSSGNVDTVNTTRPLTFCGNAKHIKRILHFDFAMPFLARSALRAQEFFFVSCFASCPRIVCALSKAGTAIHTFVRHANKSCFAAIPRIISSLNKTISNYSPRDIILAGNGQNASPFLECADDVWNGSDDFRAASRLIVPVEPKKSGATVESGKVDPKNISDLIGGLSFPTKSAKIVKINKSSFSSHVYNLETANGWYVVDGIIVSNCKCAYRYVYSLRSIPKDCLTDKGEEALNEARRKIAHAS